MNSPPIPDRLPATTVPPERILFGACVVLLLIAAALAGSISESELLLTIYGGQGGHFINVWRFVTSFGSTAILTGITVVSAALLMLCKDYISVIWLILGWGATSLGVECLKWLVDRDRPPLQFLTTVRGSSFPSGHAAESLFVYIYIALTLTRVRVGNAVAARMRNAACSLLCSVPLFIGYSRVYLGVHWPSDVLGGWAIGFFILGIAVSDSCD